MVADLDEMQNYLFALNLQHDLVVYSVEKPEVTISELTIPFESNFGSAQVRKQSKYQELVEEVEANGFDVVLITFEVGSQGFSWALSAS